MVAKMVLPLLGGTPAVWNTCMVFFQAPPGRLRLRPRLARGWLGARGHALVHLGTTAGHFAASAHRALRWRLASAPRSPSPVPGCSNYPASPVGAAVLIVIRHERAAACRQWFASPPPTANDPYFLYAASNLGSLLALSSYPVLLDRTSRSAQSKLSVDVGYAAFALTFLTCGWMASRWQLPPPGAPARPPDQRFRLPSGLPCPARLTLDALGVRALEPDAGLTAYLTTDIASIPLLWVIPLACIC